MNEQELELQRLTKRLEDEKDQLSSRIRKRIYQKIGKLKKQIAENPSPIPPLVSPKTDQKADTKSKKHALAHEEREESENKRKKIEKGPPSLKEELLREINQPPSTHLSTSQSTAASSKPTYTKKEQKTIIHLLNRELKDCAIKKQLNKAKKAFRQHCAKGLTVDIHTYSNLLNVYIRCQDIHGAKALFETIPSPNLVTYTILLRGFCESGMMAEAKQLFFEHMIPTKQWNIRSLNTFLRGCLRTGFIETAIEAFQRYQSKHRQITEMKVEETEETANDDADDVESEDDDEEEDEDDQLQQSACYESMVSLLTRSGRLHQALDLLKQYLDFTSSLPNQRGNFLITNASLTSIIAKFYTMFGFFTEARRFLLLTEEILARKEVGMGFQPTHNPLTPAPSDDPNHQKSVQLFQKFQKKEIQGLVEQCEEYISRVSSANNNSLTNEEEKKQMRLSILIYYYLLQQVIYIGFHPSNCDNEVADEGDESMEEVFYEHLTAAITNKFGFAGLKVEQLLLKGLKKGVREAIGGGGELVESLRQRMAHVFKTKSPEQSSQSTLVESQTETLTAPTYEIDLAELFSRSKSLIDNSQCNTEANDANKTEVKGYEQTLEEYYKFLDQKQEEADVERDVLIAGVNKKVKKTKKDVKSVPVCLEIGSGNGDWIVAQAAADRQLVEIEEIIEEDAEEDGGDVAEEVIEEKKKVTLSTLQKEKEKEKEKRRIAQNKNKDKNKKGVKGGQRTRKKKVWQVKANWIALELRYDRCSNILTNHFLDLALLSSYHQQQMQLPSLSSEKEEQDVTSLQLLAQSQSLPPNNLSIFSGDAKTVLQNYLPNSSISHIFINYPQPPERITAGMHGKDQGKHLYTPEVLARMIEILDEDVGKLTILSDNLLYIQLLANNLLQIAEQTVTMARKQRRGGQREFDAFVMMSSEQLEEMENVRKVQEILPIVSLATSSGTSTQPSIIIYRGDPSDECGHHVNVSSYFDRMWTLGQKKRRWFLHLTKTQV